MSVVRFKIKPKSTFVTHPKGDSIFGHFASLLFMQKDTRLQNYLEQNPPIIFSDFLPDGYLPKPTLPMDSFGVDESAKKEFRKESWVAIDDLQKGNINQTKSIEFYREKSVIRNHINRNTFATDDSGEFAPYATKEIEFVHQPVVYAYIDETTFSADEVLKILNLVGKNGFGKKSSIGKGLFSVTADESFKGFDKVASEYYLTISPTFLNDKNIKDAYYELFHRFGKYANLNQPFKKPALLAQSGAVVVLENECNYLGKALSNATVAPSFLQGYSIAVPFKFDGKGVNNVR